MPQNSIHFREPDWIHRLRKQCFQAKCGGKSDKIFIYANTVPYSTTVKCVYICSHVNIDRLIVSAVIEKASMHTKLHSSYFVLMHNRKLYVFITVKLKQTLGIFLLVFILMMNLWYQEVKRPVALISMKLFLKLFKFPMIRDSIFGSSSITKLQI